MIRNEKQARRVNKIKQYYSTDSEQQVLRKQALEELIHLRLQQPAGGVEVGGRGGEEGEEDTGGLGEKDHRPDCGVRYEERENKEFILL